MRLAIVALLALPFTAAPATAQVPGARLDPAQAAAALQNPLVQDGIAAAVAQLAGIVLDTRIGPLAALSDPDARPEDTLRDVERRRDPDYEAHLRERTRGAVATAGAVAGGVAVQSAELKRTADRLHAALAPLLAMARAARPPEDAGDR